MALHLNLGLHCIIGLSMVMRLGFLPGLLLVFFSIEICAQTPLPNPDLQISCPYSIIFVLDESGSISGVGATDIRAVVRTAATDLITALSGSGSEVAVIEFNSAARRANIGGTTNYQVVDAAYITAFTNYINDPAANTTPSANNYDPEDYSNTQYFTNWEAAFIEVQNINNGTPPAGGFAELVIFFTDGNPNAIINAQGQVQNSVAEATALSEATGAANAVKTQGSHIFVVGLPNTTITESNLIQISGTDKYPVPDPNFITGDYSVSTSATLRDDLQRIAQSVCKVDLSIDKTSSQSACAGETIVFTLIVSNNGLDNDTLVVVKDTIPSGFTYISDNGGAATTVTGNILSWNLPSLAGGGGADTLQITVNVNASGVHTNRAYASGQQVDVDSTNNQDSFTVAISQSCDDGIACTRDSCGPGGTCINVPYTVTASISPETVIICAGVSATLTASGSGGVGNYTYSWNAGATTASISVSPAATGSFTVTVTDGNGCSATTSRTVTVEQAPSASISPQNAGICNGESITLTASGGTSYSWSTGETTASITVNPVNTTQYSVTVSIAGGCTASASRNVSVNQSPNVTITPTNAAICPGNSVTFTATGAGGGGSYSWSTGATTASITVSPLLTTDYIVTVTNAQRCSVSDTVTVTVNPSLTVTISPDNISICPGANTTLTASGGTSYSWNTGATTASITVNPSVTTTYTVTASEANGCSGTASRTVNMDSLPIASISPVTGSICRGASADLTASGGTSYSWSTGATIATITVNPPSTTSFSVTVTDANGCSAIATRLVTVNPVFTDTVEAIICPGTNYVLPDGSVVNIPGLYPVTLRSFNNCDSTVVTNLTTQVCDDGDACTIDGCDSRIGCTSTPLICNDGNACTTDGCNPQTGCTTTAVVCNDQNACTTDGCNPQTGCTTTPVVCNDGNACTTDGCDQQTGCTTAAVVCNDGNACTTDGCNPSTGCTTTPVVCNDGNACTTDGCNAQTGCTTAPVICNDGSACTTDGCDPQTGCTTTGIVCDDGNACTTDGCNLQTGCTTTTVVCNDGDACTTDGCNPQTGCTTTAVVCNDGDACTTDGCDPQTGCTTTTIICDDGNACTTDACNPQTGCTTTTVICSDGNVCNGIETCDPVLGCQPGTPLTCSDGNVCNGIETCDPLLGCQPGTSLVCSDGNLCNGAETCDPVLGCQPGASLNCDDADVCTQDSCNGLTGCFTTRITCDDNNSCTIDNCVSPTIGCTYTPLNCSDGNLCTIDTCISGVCSNPPLDCDDDSLCTRDFCVAGQCMHVQIANCCVDVDDCNEGGACSVEACIGNVCYYADVCCDDGDGCTWDYCENGDCVFVLKFCEDNDPCTDNACVNDHCSFPPLNCDDNDLCTTDACINGSCVHTQAICNDGDPCTTDFCDNGCRYTPIPCTDGDRCTRDSCVQGVCISYPINCNDGNACTRDYCDNGNCRHDLIDCSDDDPCTEDNCFNGNCGHSPVQCIDNDLCTYDVCVDGICHHPSIGCDDSDPCTEDRCFNGLCSFPPVTINVSVSSTDVCDCVSSTPGQLCRLDYSGLPHGTILDEQYASYGIHVSAIANYPGKNKVVIFNTYSRGTPDPDLQVDIGNIIIIPFNTTDINPADGLVDNPNDNTTGGKMIFLFDTPRVIKSFVFVDEEDNHGTGKAYDANGNLIKSVPILQLGNASVQTVTMNASGVRQLVIEYRESGGIGEIVFGDCNTSCCDGHAAVAATGGEPPYSYHWDTGDNSSSLDNLCEGRYCVTVTDRNGCEEISCLYIRKDNSPGCSSRGSKLSNADQDGYSLEAGNGGVALTAYPNPFTDKLNIEFLLSKDSRVKLEIFNVSGQQLATLFDGYVRASERHLLEFNPGNFAGGMIVYRLKTREGIYYGKAVMVKSGSGDR